MHNGLALAYLLRNTTEGTIQLVFQGQCPSEDPTSEMTYERVPELDCYAEDPAASKLELVLNHDVPHECEHCGRITDNHCIDQGEVEPVLSDTYRFYCSQQCADQAHHDREKYRAMRRNLRRSALERFPDITILELTDCQASGISRLIFEFPGGTAPAEIRSTNPYHVAVKRQDRAAWQSYAKQGLAS